MQQYIKGMGFFFNKAPRESIIFEWKSTLTYMRDK
jgi:hypothetical protein